MVKKDLIKLNLGCGGRAIEGWINVDYALGAVVAKLPFFSRINRRFRFFVTHWDKDILIHDLRKHFPWKDNSVDIIYSSHTLEHLRKGEGLFFLKECYRVSKFNGIIRILVPDLKCLVDRYQLGSISADDFLEALGVNYDTKGENFIKRVMAPYIHYPHRCMYDLPTLIRVMDKVGFDIKESMPYESVIKDIGSIETEGRVQDAVIVEGIKK
jgi:SAM-dependent methyltransferase